MSRHPRSGSGTEDGFLSRWSRRKARRHDDERDPEGGASGTRVDDPAADAVAPADGKPADGGEPAEAERVKTDEDMPELESIDETIDMSDFFSPGVSEELRQQALRRLFRMAKFNVTDGLDDYDEDFRNFELLGDMVTSDMRHRIERQQQIEEQADLALDQDPVPDSREVASRQAGPGERTENEAGIPVADPDAAPAPDEGGRADDEAGGGPDGERA